MTEQYIYFDEVSYDALKKRGDIVFDPIKPNTNDPKYGLWYIEERKPLLSQSRIIVTLNKLNDDDLQPSYGKYIHLEFNVRPNKEEIINKLNEELSKSKSFDKIKEVLNKELLKKEKEERTKKKNEGESIIDTLKKETAAKKRLKEDMGKLQDKIDDSEFGPMKEVNPEPGETYKYKINDGKIQVGVVSETKEPDGHELGEVELLEKTPEPTGGKRKSKKSKKSKKPKKSKKSKTRKNSRKTNRRR